MNKIMDRLGSRMCPVSRCLAHPICTIIVLAVSLIFPTSVRAADVSADVVWKTSPEIESKIIELCSSSKDQTKCLTENMKKMGATPSAISFSKTKSSQLGTSCYANDFDEQGKVDILQINCLFMANTMGNTYLVNGTPNMIDVTDDKHIRQVDISKDPLYKSMASKYKNIQIWPEPSKPRMQKTANGGQRFIFSFPLLNGCRACELAGDADIGYDFDASGRFLGTKLVKLSK